MAILMSQSTDAPWRTPPYVTDTRRDVNPQEVSKNKLLCCVFKDKENYAACVGYKVDCTSVEPLAIPLPTSGNNSLF